MGPTPLASLVFLLWLALAAAVAPEAARAQTPTLPGSAPADAPLTAEDVDKALSLLEDEARRKALIADLQALRDAMRATKSGEDPLTTDAVAVLDLTHDLLLKVRQNIAMAVDAVVDLPYVFAWLGEQWREPGRRVYWGGILVNAGAPWLCGIVAAYFVRRRIEPLLSRLRAAPDAPLRQVGRASLARGAVNALPAIAFAAVGYSILWWRAPDAFSRAIGSSLLDVTAIVLALLAAARLILALRAQELRWAPLSDDQARAVYRWTSRLVAVGAAIWVIDDNAILLQAPEGVIDGVIRALGLLFMIVAIGANFASRRAVARWLGGKRADEALDDAYQSDLDGDEDERAASEAKAKPIDHVRRVAALLWPIVSTGYIIAIYLVWAFDVAIGAERLIWGALAPIVLVILARPFADRVARLVTRPWRLSERRRAQFPGLDVRMERYRRWIGRLALFASLALGIGLTARIWGLDPAGWLFEAFDPETRSFIGDLAFLALLAFVAWEIVSVYVEARLGRVDENGELVETSGRVRTLLTLARTLFAFALFAALVVGLFSVLGLSATPLLAAASVVGVAIGFGSQKLVQDFMNGAFIVFQNTIAIGDIVEIANHSGVVENMSIRTVEIRDLSGNLHTIPFSEVRIVKNYTRDFAYALFDVKIAHEDDVDDAMAIMEQVGAELDLDPVHGQHVLAPLEMFGLDRIEPDFAVVRARLRTKAGQQWGVLRAYQRLLKKRFEELGMQPPMPQRVLRRPPRPRPPPRAAQPELG